MSKPLPGRLAVAMLGAAILAPAGAARADEPIFGYVYTTDLLPKGQMEAEQWLTLREGRSEGEFHLLQARSGGAAALAQVVKTQEY